MRKKSNTLKTRANENYKAHDWDLMTEMTTDIPRYMADSPPGYADAAMSLRRRMHQNPFDRGLPSLDWNQATTENTDVPTYKDDAPVGYKEGLEYDSLRRKRMHLAPTDNRRPAIDWNQSTEENTYVPTYKGDAPIGYREGLEDSLFKGNRLQNRHFYKLAGPK